MPKVKMFSNEKGDWVQWLFHCPGCKMSHAFTTANPRVGGPMWEFNGDVENPTFSPSLLCKFPLDGKNHVCHCFVKNGQIQFLSDCSHCLAGTTVEMENADS